jgi:hypothetical protein
MGHRSRGAVTRVERPLLRDVERTLENGMKP